MRTLQAFIDKKHDLASICKDLAGKYRETLFKSLVYFSTLWMSLAGLTYLSQTFGI